MSNFKILLQQNCFATDPDQRQKAAQALEQQYNCEINCVALAPDVQFAHHGRGCTIAAAKIDQHVTIFQNVTLGSNQRFNRQTQQWEHLGGPVIGNDVVIADGAKVLGPVMIGAHTVIGAGAIITKNVPANSVAYGVNQIKPRVAENEIKNTRRIQIVFIGFIYKERDTQRLPIRSCKLILK